LTKVLILHRHQGSQAIDQDFRVEVMRLCSNPSWHVELGLCSMET